MQITRRELMAGTLVSGSAFAAPVYQPKVAARLPCGDAFDTSESIIRLHLERRMYVY